MTAFRRRRGRGDGATVRIQKVAKRIFDLVIAFCSLVLLAPLTLTIALMIRLRIGTPILFRQVRLGQGGRRFVLYKFRTMVDAKDAEGRVLPDGQRLTPLGRLLRRTTLDELPELINVVRGDLSIVGPRPLLPEYGELYTPAQWRRHEVPAGMAGPVPASGRNALTWDEKFKLDLWYVDNWSLWLDVKILTRSVWKVLRMEGINADGHATMPPFEGSSGSETKSDAE
jgi:sugar transferase EpsL